MSLTFVLGSSPCVPRNSGALNDGSAGGFQGIHPEVCLFSSPAGGFPQSPDHREVKQNNSRVRPTADELEEKRRRESWLIQVPTLNLSLWSLMNSWGQTHAHTAPFPKLRACPSNLDGLRSFFQSDPVCWSNLNEKSLQHYCCVKDLHSLMGLCLRRLQLHFFSLRGFFCGFLISGGFSSVVLEEVHCSFNYSIHISAGIRNIHFL